jgi:hypothetical protein
MSSAARNPPYLYEPAEDGSFIVSLGDDLLGRISLLAGLKNSSRAEGEARCLGSAS